MFYVIFQVIIIYLINSMPLVLFHFFGKYSYKMEFVWDMVVRKPIRLIDVAVPV